jgi:hypothetical protein
MEDVRSYSNEKYIALPDKLKNIMVGDRFYFRDESFYGNSRNWNWWDCDGLSVLNDIDNILDDEYFSEIKETLDSSKFYVLDIQEKEVDCGDASYPNTILICLAEASDGTFFFGSTSSQENTPIIIESAKVSERHKTLKSLIEILVKKIANSDEQKRKTIEISINLLSAALESIESSETFKVDLDKALKEFDTEINRLIQFFEGEKEALEDEKEEEDEN